MQTSSLGTLAKHMNTFDRILWRTNGILILVGILGLLFFIAVILMQASLFSTRQKKEAAVVTSDEKQEKQYFQLRSGSLLAGNGILRSPLLEIESGKSFSRSGYGGFIKNYLFLNPCDLKSWWLLPNHKGIIREAHDLCNPQTGDSKRVVSTIYEIIAKDTNGDGKIASDDNTRAYFSTNQDDSVTELTGDSTQIISVQQTSDAQVIILFQTPSDTRCKSISIVDGSTISETVISLNQ